MTAATFGGPGWRHRDTVSDDPGWADFAVDSEWAPLSDVTLYAPGDMFDVAEDFNENLFLAPTSADELRRDVDRLSRVYAEAGVRVHQAVPGTADDGRLPNACFQRDVYWSTPLGVVIGRMAGAARAGEEAIATRTLAQLGARIALTVVAPGTLEGADCLWLRPDTVLCGVDGRTNKEAAHQIARLLAVAGIAVHEVPVPRGVQHLLGCIQLVSPDRALVRTELIDEHTLDVLRRAGYEVLAVPEHAEVRHGFAMNVVTVAADSVVMPRSAWLRERLHAWRIETREVDVTALLKAGGGIGCSTGILARETLGGN
jgi:N-dimethylarginine dimethylaminohydrolase